MATNALKQLINQTLWGELDFLLIDMPPGTGDVQIAVAENLRLTGAVIVSTPQAVATADVVRGMKMFRTKGVEVPVLGVIENMAWFTPLRHPDEKYFLFGKNGAKHLAEELGVTLLAQIPLVEDICSHADSGAPIALSDNIEGAAFLQLAGAVRDEVNRRNKELPPTKKVEVTKR